MGQGRNLTLPEIDSTISRKLARFFCTVWTKFYEHWLKFPVILFKSFSLLSGFVFAYFLGRSRFKEVFGANASWHNF